MQRVGFVGVFAIVFLFASCDINPMDTEIEQGVIADPENEGLQYLTVTYHSNLHTSGEVPVDTRRYVVPRLSNTLPPHFIVRPEEATALGQGTLERDGFVFIGWVVAPGPFSVQPGDKFYVLTNMRLYARWEPRWN